MIYIGQYKELNSNHNFPSIKEFIQNEPFEGKQKIIDYLSHGQEDMVRAEITHDVISGEKINMEMIGMNDGEYTWFNTLAYYVDKYNLRLPHEFEQKVLGKHS